MLSNMTYICMDAVEPRRRGRAEGKPVDTEFEEERNSENKGEAAKRPKKEERK